MFNRLYKITKNFRSLHSPSSLYSNLSRALTLVQNLSYLGNFSSSVLSFSYQKARWKVQTNVVTPQALVINWYAENQINRWCKKMFCVLALRKNCLLLIRSEKWYV